jgi:hypothetical protein
MGFQVVLFQMVLSCNHWSKEEASQSQQEQCTWSLMVVNS